MNIVGFAIESESLAATFETWARKGGGAYFAADTPEDLETSIRAAISPRFNILRTYPDGSTESVGYAALNEALVVPAGNLTISPTASANGSSVTRRVFPGEEVSLTYSADTGFSRP